jgi:hypothetical protein
LRIAGFFRRIRLIESGILIALRGDRDNGKPVAQST